MKRTPSRPVSSPPETISGLLPASVPAPAMGRAMGSAGTAAVPAARSVEMVWRDPVTDERLSIAILATPELIRRLESEGFEVEAKMEGRVEGRIEGRIEGQIARSAG